MNLKELRSIKFMTACMNNFDDNDIFSQLEKMKFLKEMEIIYNKCKEDLKATYETHLCFALISYDQVLNKMVNDSIQFRIESIRELYKITKNRIIKLLELEKEDYEK